MKMSDVGSVYISLHVYLYAHTHICTHMGTYGYIYIIICINTCTYINIILVSLHKYPKREKFITGDYKIYKLKKKEEFINR